MCDIVDLEEALLKTGAELFKELYRVYPVAEPEDYIKNGSWRNDLMKSDLVLFESHRREAGAPDPPDLEDCKFPVLPAASNGITSTLASKLGQPAAAGATAVPAAQGAAVEIRLMALFVAKWKLDPASSKTLLSKLPATRRRYVIQHFKATAGGVEGTSELEKYIEECEKEGAWDTATAGATTPASGTTPSTGVLKFVPRITPVANATVRPSITSAVTTPRPGGITPVSAAAKRPIIPAAATAPPAWAQNKRPALGGGTSPGMGMIRPAATVVAPRPAKAAPAKAGPSLVRPPIRPAAGAGGKIISGLLEGF
jgi:hypothetical protein